ncbi:MAG: signal peptidase I [Bacilli bacterium]|nr:signal peptidase I [Bacilli bacterium]
MNQEKIGKFIAKIRKEKNMTQQELADKLNVTDRAISKWERGKGTPDISLLIPLSKELNISVLELLSGNRITNENDAVINIIKQDNKKIRFWKWLFLGTMNVILIIATLFLINSYIIPNKYNSETQGMIKVVSNSMLPTLKVGDIIVYDKVPINNVKEKDIIVYYFETNNFKIIHRVSSINFDSDGKILLKTKGDNNLEEDPNSITEDTFLGIYNHKASGLTNLFLKEKSTLSVSTVIIILILIIIIINLDSLEVVKLISKNKYKRKI